MQHMQFQDVTPLKTGGLKVTYTRETNAGEEEITHRKPQLRHPDLDDAFTDFKEHVIRVHRLMGARTNLSQMDEAEKAYYSKVCAEITILGITFSGEDKTEGLLIRAKRTTEINSKPVSLNTPFIQYNSYAHGIELEELAGKLKSEVGMFLNDEKVAQQQLFPKAGASESSEDDEDEEAGEEYTAGSEAVAEMPAASAPVEDDEDMLPAP